MGYPKKHRGRRKMGSKKRRAKKEIKRNNLYSYKVQNLLKIKKISIWIFIIPFVALNACLILITNFQQFFAPQDIIHNTIPYIDGGASISRTARVFPTYLIFKPAMFVTAYLLIQYWRYNSNFMGNVICQNLNYNKFFVFFGVGSAIFLVLHSIFLGIKV